MTAFISSGHNPKGKRDPGAVSRGIAEADKAKEFKELVIPIAIGLGVKVVTDKDDESLGAYLKRIQTGAGSVVVEFHFDAGIPKATGTTAIVGADADRLDKSFAKELVDATSEILNIRNRGVLSEADSHRGRLGLMREQGTVALLELCFISNPDDMEKYEKNKICLAAKIAQIIKKYEDLVP